MWRIVHNGTAKVGMRLSGKLPSDTRAIPSDSTPMALLLVSTPVPRATTKSTSPATFSHITWRRHVGLRRTTASDERRRVADGHIAGAGRPGERARQEIERVEDEEHDTDHAPALGRREEPEIDREREVAEAARRAIDRGEGQRRRGDRHEDRQRWARRPGLEDPRDASREHQQKPSHEHDGESRRDGTITGAAHGQPPPLAIRASRHHEPLDGGTPGPFGGIQRYVRSPASRKYFAAPG